MILRVRGVKDKHTKASIATDLTMCHAMLVSIVPGPPGLEDRLRGQYWGRRPGGGFGYIDHSITSYEGFLCWRELMWP